MLWCIDEHWSIVVLGGGVLWGLYITISNALLDQLKALLILEEHLHEITNCIDEGLWLVTTETYSWFIFDSALTLKALVRDLFEGLLKAGIHE